MITAGCACRWRVDGARIAVRQMADGLPGHRRHDRARRRHAAGAASSPAWKSFSSHDRCQFRGPASQVGSVKVVPRGRRGQSSSPKPAQFQSLARVWAGRPASVVRDARIGRGRCPFSSPLAPILNGVWRVTRVAGGDQSGAPRPIRAAFVATVGVGGGGAAVSFRRRGAVAIRAIFRCGAGMHGAISGCGLKWCGKSGVAVAARTGRCRDGLRWGTKASQRITGGHRRIRPARANDRCLGAGEAASATTAATSAPAPPHGWPLWTIPGSPVLRLRQDGRFVSGGCADR